MTVVPNADKAIVDPTKITGYLLDITHQKGKFKASFFLRFGFTAGNVSALVSALAEHARTRHITDTVPSSYGMKYITECKLQTPDGRHPCITVVWMMNDQNIPRLITALPRKSD
jgi:filamentous hemagglutinin